MNSEARRRLRDPELIAARDRHFSRLQAVFDGKPVEHTCHLWGYPGQAKGASPYDQPEQWVAEVLADLAANADLLKDDLVFRPLCIEAGLYGVHFIDRMLGAETFELTPGNWQCRTLDTPIGALQPVDLDTDDTWARERRIVEVFLAADVTVPLYGLPTLSAVQNIALNLYGDALLVAMFTDPEAVHHDLKVINGLICTLHRWYLDHVPLRQLQPVVSWARTQPPGYGQLCGCSCQLLSEGQYAEFIAPYDDALLSVYPKGGMIHLCGAHTQHINTWRGMKSLRAITINDRAMDDLEAYFEGLREDQIIYPIPYEGMTAEQTLAITGGHRTVLLAETDGPVPVRRK